MTNHEIRNAFRAVYGGNKTNFMTPDVIGYGMSGDYLFEISTGRDRSLFGVTVITKGLEKSALSTCFDTLADADHFAARL
jgi:hypothetical protein